MQPDPPAVPTTQGAGAQARTEPGAEASTQARTEPGAQAGAEPASQAGSRPEAPKDRAAHTRRWRLDVAYDGSGFHGFAAQDGVATVAGSLATAIARAARLAEPPLLVCAGRTDAGVHATGQVVHVDLPEDYEGNLQRAVNRQLSPSIVLRAAAPASEGFDARRAATSRHYRYLVLAAPEPDPLLAGLVWHVPDPLDLRAMASATDPLLGEHDFRAFCRRAPGRSAEEPIIRRVTAAGWRRVPALGAVPGTLPGDLTGSLSARDAGTEPGSPELLRFDIEASSFCHQMVRSIVAVLVDAGRGRATAASVMALLASGSRAGAPQPAPAHGLCLVAVSYGVSQVRPGATRDESQARPGATRGEDGGEGGLPLQVPSR